jgi:hypothetical protein
MIVDAHMLYRTARFRFRVIFKISCCKKQYNSAISCGNMQCNELIASQLKSSEERETNMSGWERENRHVVDLPIFKKLLKCRRKL